MPDFGVTRENRAPVAELLHRVLDAGLDFKLSDSIFERRGPAHLIRDMLLEDLPDAPEPLHSVLDRFAADVLPYCKNEASPHFLGFGDTGDDIAALCGALLGMFTQQNLINQSFDSPSGSFIEFAVLRWLRELLGYQVADGQQIDGVWDVGGCITHGGTLSNTIAMMLARENHRPNTMIDGVNAAADYQIIVPRGIGHYSVKSALAWIGCGAHLIEVDTVEYRYDQRALAAALRENRGTVMAVVAYAGDSRTHTVEHLRAVHSTVRDVDPDVWLHADACWGLACAFTPSLAGKIDGIELFDSITVDPHKVMAVPYGLSALLVRDPAALRTVASFSDLIMQEDFAIGQSTPFIGTKAWISLKLWLMIKTHGRKGLAAMADQRLATTRAFVELIDAQPRLLRLHDPDLTAVAFLYLPSGTDLGAPDIDRINAVNQAIHARMLDEGRWFLHQFSLPDSGRLERGAVIYPLRFMAQNLRIERHHLTGVIDYVLQLGCAFENHQ